VPKTIVFGREKGPASSGREKKRYGFYRAHQKTTLRAAIYPACETVRGILIWFACCPTVTEVFPFPFLSCTPPRFPVPPLPISADAGLSRRRHADTLHTGNTAPPVSSASLPASTQLRGGYQHRGGHPCLRRTTRKTHIGVSTLVADCSGAALPLLIGRWRDSMAHHATTMWAQTRTITVEWHCHSTPPTRPQLQRVDHPTTPTSSKAWCALGTAPPTHGSRWRAMGHHATECPMLSSPAL
jgi:hypothetical protein